MALNKKRSKLLIVAMVTTLGLIIATLSGQSLQPSTDNPDAQWTGWTVAKDKNDFGPEQVRVRCENGIATLQFRLYFSDSKPFSYAALLIFGEGKNSATMQRETVAEVSTKVANCSKLPKAVVQWQITDELYKEVTYKEGVAKSKMKGGPSFFDSLFGAQVAGSDQAITNSSSDGVHEQQSNSHQSYPDSGAHSRSRSGGQTSETPARSRVQISQLIATSTQFRQRSDRAVLSFTILDENSTENIRWFIDCDDVAIISVGTTLGYERKGAAFVSGNNARSGTYITSTLQPRSDTEFNNLTEARCDVWAGARTSDDRTVIFHFLH